MRSGVSILRLITSIGIAICVLCRGDAVAQQPGQNLPGPNQQAPNLRPAIAPNGNQANPLFPNANAPNNMATNNRRGASANADFDSLIDLIESTVATDSWAENGGGTAEIRPFYGGVMVDAAGMLRLKSQPNGTKDLAAKRGLTPPSNAISDASARHASTLRYVSLPRLEREILRRQAAHERLDASMLTLAGLQRVRYVFVYPETGDLVLAGPAGDWFTDKDGRILSTETREPVVRLDDLLTIWRRGPETVDSHFGCSINPRQAALARTQAFLAASSQKPLEPSHRKQWLADLRDSVGKQDIDIFGIDPASRVASVLVEADYHMKLIGMGLADGVDGVESYLKSIHLRPGETPPPMSVLRWWFALKYDAISRSEAKDAFELVGQGVRVLSENEMLAEQGQRVHTGASDPLNRQFAESFTSHFVELAKKYPVYGELRNIFDLAMAVALVHSEGLMDRAKWTPTVLASGDKLRVPHGNVPREVETVVNHRVINQRLVIAGVSGGVMVAPSDVLRETRARDSAATAIKRPAAVKAAAGVWWWDAGK